MEPLVKKCGSSSDEDGYLPKGYGWKCVVDRMCREDERLGMVKKGWEV
jgi:hypothetical protein